MAPRLLFGAAAAAAAAVAVVMMAATPGCGAAVPAPRGAMAAPATAVVAPSAARQATAGTPPTLAALVAKRDDLSILEEALKLTGLWDTLAKANTSSTLFAPNDAAFVDLSFWLKEGGSDKAGALKTVLGELGLIAGFPKVDPVSSLAAFLEFHMTDGAVSLKDLVAARGYTSVNGERVKLGADNKTLVDTATSIDDVKILETDIAASNGVMHIVGGVMFPTTWRR
ncbi:hypothetical protein I4F81_007605 [Pyropia yezoensis]|uniref:Uncharacterized protein n=1 Tax=Pyropia yezoensis TaxID=2788 RepID=A0ACC3C523_PYRYE|nr:hypothetical protein I4F81_007605 [Neopyropia yezoensis]